MHSSTSFATAAFAVIGAAAAQTVPDLTDFTGDVGTFAVDATFDAPSGSNWANFSIENTKLSAKTECSWEYNPNGDNPHIVLGTKNQVVLYLTECDTPGFLVYWGNSSQSLQINYNTTLSGRPVHVGASNGLIPDCADDSTSCSQSGNIDINSLALLDNAYADADASQDGYWDVTYRNFTSKVDAGYRTEDFTFQYSEGGYVNCFKTTTEANADPNSFCTGDLDVQFDTAVVPERSLSLNSTVDLDGTNTTLIGTAPIRGVCYDQPGGLVCLDRLRVQVSEATA